MDPGSLSFPSAMVVMVCLLGAARISSGDEQKCKCPEIPQWPQTETPGKTCYEVGGKYRYKCVDGRVREAGTSSLIKCEQSEGTVYWTKPTLNCKPDPRLPINTVQTTPKRNATQSPGSTVPTNPKRNATQSPGSTVPMTSSSPQTTWSVSSLATVTGETEREETTINATLQTQAPTVSNQTDTNSTYKGALHEAHKGTVPAVCISIFIVMACALIMIYVLYRRKLKNIVNSQQSTDEPDELQPMKGAPEP